MKTVYMTKDTCSREIHLDISEGKINEVSFVGGCSGNLKAVSALVKGMDIENATKILKGITCGSRPTSCADQLATALQNITKA